MLCIAGRDPSTGLWRRCRQLLRKHGLGAQSALHGEVSSAIIFDTTGVALIFITYAELQGNPPHMRTYCVGFDKDPLCPVFVGFWDPDDALLGDPAAQEMAGATAFASSLHDAVSKCLHVRAATGEQDLLLAPRRGSCLARRSSGGGDGALSRTRSCHLRSQVALLSYGTLIDGDAVTTAVETAAGLFRR